MTITQISLILFACLCTACSVQPYTVQPNLEHQENGYMINTRSKIVVIKNAISPNLQKFLKREGASYSDHELQQLAYALALTKGANIMTAPGIVSKDLQLATVEISKEIPQNRVLGKEQQPWIAHHLQITSKRHGKTICSTINYKYHHIEGMSNNSLGDFNLKSTKGKKFDIQEYTTTQNIAVRNGMSKVIKIDAPKGETRYLILTQQLVNAVGQAIK